MHEMEGDFWDYMAAKAGPLSPLHVVADWMDANQPSHRAAAIDQKYRAAMDPANIKAFLAEVGNGGMKLSDVIANAPDGISSMLARIGGKS